ncbi:MAG: methyltransferase domain-containing protein [Myxococcota bacterium]
MGAENVWDQGRWRLVRRPSFDFMTRYIAQQMVAAVSPAGRTFLELGCGTGRLSRLMLDQGASHVTMVDSSRRALALARKLFEDVSPSRYDVVESDILEYRPPQRFDVVFSSGVVEHFDGPQRRGVMQHHLDLCSGDCLIIHPTDTLYARWFSRFPLAVALYGFQRPFSDEEMTAALGGHARLLGCSHQRFHVFYTIPALHNRSILNRAADMLPVGKELGGLTLTHARVSAPG